MGERGTAGPAVRMWARSELGRRWKALVAPDAIVFGTQAGADNADYTPVLRLPEVIGGGQFELAQVGLVGLHIGSLPPGDTQLYRTISRPLVRDVSTRSPSTARPPRSSTCTSARR